MRSGGVQNAAEKGCRRRKIWKASKDVWKPCNHLKSHKTAKDFFGKAWSETRDFWRSLEKGLEGAIIPPPLAPSHQRPPIERDRHCEERSDEATRGWRHPAPGLLRCARPEHTDKRKARFIQADRLGGGAELAMTAVYAREDGGCPRQSNLLERVRSSFWRHPKLDETRSCA